LNKIRYKRSSKAYEVSLEPFIARTNLFLIKLERWIN